MNRYGAQAMKHWREFRPSAFSDIQDPNSFFSTLGEEVAAQIEARTDELAGPDQPGEGYLAKLGRINTARQMAEEEILPEQVLAPPEPTEDEELNDSEATDPSSEEGWIPMEEDPTHPFWQQAAEDAEIEALDAQSDPGPPTR